MSTAAILAAETRAAFDPVVVFGHAFGFAPHAWQIDYLRESRPTAVLKGRQVGASLAAAALCIHMAIYNPGSLAAVISPSLKQSSEIATRARSGLRTLGIRLVQDSTSQLRLQNGSRILSMPGTARSVRGFSASLLILDEAAFIEPATFIAARALVATGGRWIVQSTPAGEHGDFYELLHKPDPGVARFVVRSDSVATITPEFLAVSRRAMSPDAYAQEFEATFGRSGGGLFTAERIASLLLPDPQRQETP